MQLIVIIKCVVHFEGLSISCEQGIAIRSIS